MRIVFSGASPLTIITAKTLMKQGHEVPGVIAVPQTIAVGVAVDDLTLIVQCTTANDWQNQVGYLPLG